MEKILSTLFIISFIGISGFLAYELYVYRYFEKGALQVTSLPPSDVYLEGELIGKTPFCKCEGNNMLPRGEYIIRLIPKDSSLEFIEEKINIYKGLLTVVDRTFAAGGKSEMSIISLTPLADKTSSQIRIISIPDGVDVFLNNKLVGKSPLLLKAVPESQHMLTLQKDGYKKKTTALLTTKGYEVNAIMQLAVESRYVLATSSAIVSSTNHVDNTNN